MTIDIFQQVRLIDEKIEKLNKEKVQRIMTWCQFKKKLKADFMEAFEKENAKTQDQQMWQSLREFIEAPAECTNEEVSEFLHKSFRQKAPEHTQKLTATKIFTFDAAHYLEGHPGACKRLHGHTYKLEITFQNNPRMPVSGYNPPDMVLDFSLMKQVVNEIIIDKFDHQLINEVPEWIKTNLRPTAENMVEVFADRIMKAKNGWYAGNLVSIRLWETPTSFATWTK